MSAEEEPERLIVRLRPHGRALILPAVLLCAFGFATMFFLDRVSTPWWNGVVVTCAVILTFILCVVPTLAWLTRRFVFTTKRVIMRGGFGSSRREVPLNRIHDVMLRRVGVQALFGCGDILISTGGERSIALGDVPSAALVQRMLMEQLDREPEAPAELEFS
ncbi:PH domain-containing protein [Humidisolicoccus flavus]|uniref:PH domain-containing protein n=1 Tax=Humidisolicoccus flavus TaxID=3111414 RepID=UPI00324A077F